MCMKAEAAGSGLVPGLVCFRFSEFEGRSRPVILAGRFSTTEVSLPALWTDCDAHLGEVVIAVEA